MSRSRLASAVLVSLVVALLGCQAITEQLPTQPTPSASPGSAVIPLTIPVILPKPTPAPTPVPTPPPAATPAPPPAASSCGLPPSNPASYTQEFEAAQFLGTLEKAITTVTQQKPGLFDFEDKKCDNCYFVKDVDRYHAEVMKVLGAQGFCTFFDGEELGIKNTNSYNEQYDIILGSGHIRRGAGAYRGTCRPSWF